jgi:hypothetical protein
MLGRSIALAVALTCGLEQGRAQGAPETVPSYAHILVIVEENKNYEQLTDARIAPNFARLAKTYGEATQFFGEVHPSEANYVALLGGDTFGIHDDDAFYCHAGLADQLCEFANEPGYADHTVKSPHLGEQLVGRGLSWKGYYENLPSPGSLKPNAGIPGRDDGTRKTAFYASKHSGFINFASVQQDPGRAGRIVGFDQLDADLKADRLPSFALVVPNQCNEMHGLKGPGLPPGCSAEDVPALIRRGDKVLAGIVKKVQATRAWRSSDNFAIVVTFDEGAGKTREGCCGVTPDAPSNFGGGHIPTIVIANHGPRAVSDATPYNHYSLLRTIEDAFGIDEHLGHAADTDKGVQPMVKLFETPGR